MVRRAPPAHTGLHAQRGSVEGVWHPAQPSLAQQPWWGLSTTPSPVGGAQRVVEPDARLRQSLHRATHRTACRPLAALLGLCRPPGVIWTSMLGSFQERSNQQTRQQGAGVASCVVRAAQQRAMLALKVAIWSERWREGAEASRKLLARPKNCCMTASCRRSSAPLFTSCESTHGVSHWLLYRLYLLAFSMATLTVHMAASSCHAGAA